MCETPQLPSSPCPAFSGLVFSPSQSDYFQEKKKWYPTDPKFLSSGIRLSHQEGVWRGHAQIIPHGESPRGWTPWPKACSPSLLWETFQFRRQTSLSHSCQYHPFPKLPYGLAHWITGRRHSWASSGSSPKEIPMGDRTAVTGNRDLATNSPPNSFQTAFDTNLKAAPSKCRQNGTTQWFLQNQ